MTIREIRAALTALLKQAAPGVPVSKSDTVTEDILTSGIKESVAAYLAGTVFTQDYISYAQIGAAIMNTPGVIDYAGLKVSGGIVNIAIAERECPVLGEVTITYG